MAKFYIISIGGSGALASESLVHLCATGLLPEHELKFLIIDPDQTNSNVVRLQQTINDYKNIRENITQSDKPSIYFGTKIDAFPNVWNPNSGNAYNLENGISTIEMTSEKLLPFKLLTNLLFSDYKRKEKLDKGYKGNPMIGTIFMNEIKDSPVFNELLKESELNLFVFGSLFGGTGAAGLPVIGKTARKYNRPEASYSRIGACITLPYFSVKPLSKSQIEDYKKNNIHLLPDSSTFLPAVKFAMPFYTEKALNKENGYDSIYFIGCPDSCLASSIEFAEGGTRQNNDSHYINMFSALSFKHFVDNITALNKSPNTSFFATGVNFTDNYIKYDNLLESLKFDNISHLEPLYISAIYYLKYFLEKAKTEPEAMTWFSHEKNGLGLKNTFISNDKFIFPLKSFMEKYLIWLAQMKDNPIGLKIFNTSYYEKGVLDMKKFDEELIGKYFLEDGNNPTKKLFSTKHKIEKLNVNFNDVVEKINRSDDYKRFLDTLYNGSLQFIKKTYSKN